MMQQVNGIPVLGLGTAKRNGDEGVAAIEAALEVGYRHLDTAQDYRSEEECGRAVASSGLKREEIFFTTKVSTDYLGPGQVIPSLRRSADALGVDTIDLALIHWPARYDEFSLETYMPQIVQAREAGLAKQIGVSNFPISYIDRAVEIVGPGVLVNNQVEVHPFLQNRQLAAHCRSLGIAITCYMPIAGGKVANDPEIKKIAAKHDATPAQVSLAYLMALGMIVIPSSTSPKRLQENFDSLKLRLDDDDMRAMAQRDRNERLIVRDWGPKFD